MLENNPKVPINGESVRIYQRIDDVETSESEAEIETKKDFGLDSNIP